ncbi:MAG: hypothetical protein H6717_35275 [Polyangiaceae bacterium]|nr:hypothetical protein [Polyangiaceae bacterium]
MWADPAWHGDRNARGEMDVDRLIRWGAPIVMVAIATGLWFARSEPTEAPATSASVQLTDPLPVRTGAAREQLADDIAHRGEAALGARGPAPDQQKKPKPARAARDLPIATPKAAAKPRARKPSQCGGVEVHAITASVDPKWAFASLSPEPGEPAHLRQPGDSIGSWRVDKIEWDRVWLRSGAGRCAVTLSDGAREGAELGKKLGNKGLVFEAAPEVEPWRVPGEIANAIESDGDGRYSIERAMVKPLFDRGGALMSGIELTPEIRAEQVVGVSIGGIREDSLLERLGVESGDVLMSLDDKPCTTLQAVVDALLGAREADRLVARLERQGQPFELEVRVR